MHVSIVKKIISILLVVSMLLGGLTCFAFATDLSAPAAAYSDGGTRSNSSYSFIGSTEDLTRSTKLPKSYHNLAEEDYSEDFEKISRSWIYTGKYFHPNGDGEIYVIYDVAPLNLDTELYIGLYDLTMGELVVEFGAIEVGTEGKNAEMYFYNLVVSHNYAVCLKSYPMSLTGSVTIHH